jgi:hypothetical protein
LRSLLTICRDGGTVVVSMPDIDWQNFSSTGAIIQPAATYFIVYAARIRHWTSNQQATVSTSELERITTSTMALKILELPLLLLSTVMR